MTSPTKGLTEQKTDLDKMLDARESYLKHFIGSRNIGDIRAALSEAAAICDWMAKEAKNAGKYKRGGIKMSALYQAKKYEECAENIWKLREKFQS